MILCHFAAKFINLVIICTPLANLYSAHFKHSFQFAYSKYHFFELFKVPASRISLSAPIQNFIILIDAVPFNFNAYPTKFFMMN